jgi:hypothetical protein
MMKLPWQSLCWSAFILLLCILGSRSFALLSRIITDEDFEMVKVDLVNLMLAKTKLKRSKDGPTSNEASASEFVVATPITQTDSKHRKFRGLNTTTQTNKIQMRQRKMIKIPS